MKRSKKKIIFVLLCIVILIFTGYQIFNKNNNFVSTETIVSNVKNEKVSMPYINPAWEEYMQLSDEEKEKVEIVPNMVTYTYIPKENLYGNYANLQSRFTLRDEYPTAVKNQKNEGLCWAYAATTMMESNLKVTKGIDEEFSVQQLNYLTGDEESYENEYNPYSRNREVSDGGHISSNFLALGVVPVKNEKFTIPEGKINISDVTNTNNIDYTITEAVEFPLYENTEEYRNMLKSFIKKYGAVYTSVSSNDVLSEYEGKGPVKWMSGDSTDHAVAIIGWDDNGTYYDARENWSDEDLWEKQEGGVWIVQNSWTNDYDYENTGCWWWSLWNDGSD